MVFQTIDIPPVLDTVIDVIVVQVVQIVVVSVVPILAGCSAGGGGGGLARCPDPAQDAGAVGPAS